MRPTGVTLHQSACTSINGKGYDFFIARSGLIIPSSEATDPNRIHICIEGDFSCPEAAAADQVEEQLFIAHKLILRLALLFHFDPNDLIPHTEHCPGKFFPWSELVISPADGYH
ncbi:MAG: hypothetical protein K0Q59_4575 [Paenibacillus sp.]|jgi:hypothetical protein|nr:hypothetical protein [Paenibacillus sp.]